MKILGKSLQFAAVIGAGFFKFPGSILKEIPVMLVA
jgi:hypothetical protein